MSAPQSSLVRHDRKEVMKKLKNIVIVWFKKKLIFAGVIGSGLLMTVIQ